MTENNLSALPAVWGGIECTINRVRNTFFSQLDFSGFYLDASKLDHIIDLGIKTLRFPILWEQHHPESDSEIDFTTVRGQLARLKENHITPITGLLHHGSGPAFTNLLDENFPELFSAYARQVAQQFPEIEFYTPVNEPLTTARFSGLYGLWYPHRNNDVSFVKMLLNQLKATVLAMQEIRRVNPRAKLVQTEDLSKTYSSKLLSYQANFENHRRWLTFDLLTGQLTETHTLWQYFMRLGISPETLQFFIDNPCPPDLIGLNYYVTSERYLDHQYENYPSVSPGNNGIHTYVDIEAVRVPVSQPHGLFVLLKEVWERYRLPLAITEAHLHCSREEQVRWVNQVYETACDAVKEGVDLRAVTVWALLGSVGWNKLLTSFPGAYECGAFDVYGKHVRATAISAWIKARLQKGNSTEEVLKSAGWWQQDNRFLDKARRKSKQLHSPEVRPVIILGKNGTLGHAFEKVCNRRNISARALCRQQADLTSYESLKSMIENERPWAIINAAGFVRVDDAESHENECYAVNTKSVAILSELCQKEDIKLLSFSSDLVFDGSKNAPYVESDQSNPLNTYGKSKAMAELHAIGKNPAALIIRTSAFFGPWDRYNFVYHVVTSLQNSKQFEAAADQYISPTYVPHLANVSLDLLIDDMSGIVHLTNQGSVSWYQFAMMIALQAGLNTDLIMPVYDLCLPAVRPLFSVLSSERYFGMPSLEIALTAYFNEYDLLSSAEPKYAA